MISQTRLILFDDSEEDSKEKMKRESDLLKEFPTLMDFEKDNKLAKRYQKSKKQWKEKSRFIRE